MNKKREILLITLILIVQTIIFVIAGVNKSYIHMDEAYSLGLASYNKVEIQDNEDFYDTWHNKEYYEDYLTVNDDEVGKYAQVYVNQKNDVHPPLYYLILRIAMGFSKNHYSKWPGIVVNIIIYMFITIFMYLILEKILANKEKAKEKAMILAFISSITMASLTNVIYIRMYALSTLNIAITTYLHMKLLDSQKLNYKLLIGIGLSALAGSLTHYYYLFYLAMLYLLFAIKYIKEKNFKNLIWYTVAMGIAGILSLVIFPYSIKHMFFGYRGQGVISKLMDVPQFLTSIIKYLIKIHCFGFNNFMFIILGIILVAIICNLIKNKKVVGEKNKYTKFIILPTLFYFILVAVASPWIELRYIMPVCGLIFVLVIYYLYELLNNILGEKESNILVGLMLVVVLIAPAIFKIEPEVAFSDKKEIVQKLGNELNVPTIYFFNSNCNRFLDDILLFATVDESYVAKDMEYTVENINQILEGKDTANGLVIFINEGQENDDILAIVKEATNLSNCEYLKRLNACDVYYLN
ncbi:MAG: hypothetical protein ACI4U9_02025 [Clostridia bacterium]